MDQMIEFNGIKIHKNPPKYINEFSKTLLSKYYSSDETITAAIARPAVAFCAGDLELAQRIYSYVYNGWFMYASPVLSNAPKGSWVNGKFNMIGKLSGLPISCYAFDVPDTVEGQKETMKELAMLSVSGGGTGAHNSIRGTTNKAPGPIPYMKVLDSIIGYFRQGATRRGALAYYMDVQHPDILEHLRFRIPGGDAKRRSDNRQQFHNAINLTDEFISAVLNNTTYDLVCPHSGIVYDTLKARDVWQEILETRALTGEPYLLKIDLANRMLPETQRKLGLKVRGSNLCLTGDSLIEIKQDINSDSVLIKLQDFNDLYTLGYYKQVFVKSYEDNNVVWSLVTNSAKIGTTTELYEIENDDGSIIRCTSDHKIFTKNRGYVMAQDLLETDELVIA